MEKGTSTANPHQFVLSKDARPGYSARFELGGWLLHHGEAHAQTKILDRAGNLIGCFLGSVVDFASNSFRPDAITVAWEAGSDFELLEQALYERAGSWIAIIVTPHLSAVYLDACGSMPLVYFEGQPLAGASASALLDRSRYFDDLYEEAKSDRWFKSDWYHTAGLTAHRSLKRLLPNHRLDLQSWTVRRIWPLQPLVDRGIEQAADEISQAARATIEIAMSGRKALMPLTAGNETRALLSLTRGFQQDLTFFTGSFPGAIVDLGTARRLSKRLELRHVISKVRAKTDEEIRDWRFQTGHCVGGAVGQNKLDRRNIADAQVEFSGAAGEVGRGYLWSSGDTHTSKLSSAVLLARLKLPPIERFKEAVSSWLGSVEQFDAFTIMDLAYIELKMACWAGPQAPGSDTLTVQIWPLSSRRCFTAMMSAPLDVRRDQSLFMRMVQRQWPELLLTPINRGTAWENLNSFMYRASSPRRIWAKIRKSLAEAG
ncbi:MAG TPA: hypothetical protein VN670_07610 [Acidobacteriaceae bacterium]|nr:hypothetical protein [Acidobacteriaceae bacterium]